MPFYVVVRGDATAIGAAATAQSGTTGVGVAPLAFTTTGGTPDVVEIVSFATQQAAIDFSRNAPAWFGTVYATQADAEKNAYQRIQGQ